MPMASTSVPVELGFARGSYGEAKYTYTYTYTYTNDSTDGDAIDSDLERHRIIAGVGCRF